MARKGRSTRALLVGLFLGYLLIQIGIPIVQFQGDTPTRGGWQMFSDRRPAPEFVVVMADGSEEVIALSDFVAFPRADLPLETTLPAHWGRVLPGAEAVVINQAALVPCL